MRVSDAIYLMLLTQPFFATFTGKPLADATQVTEAIVALSAESDQEVDALADRALAAGASPHSYDMEMPGMHGRAFADPDGHQWEVLHTDPSFFLG